MAVQPIRLFGDPVLRQRAVEVDDFDRELRQLVTDLTDTMLAAPGAGLAAPQIGVGPAGLHLERRGRARPPGQPRPSSSPTRPRTAPRAACRLPELTYDCLRALSVVATGFDMYGEPLRIEASELLARAMQHETDHLDGILFIDKLDTAARKAAMKEIRESEWFGLERPTVQVQPPRRRTDSPDEGPQLMRVVFAGTPEVAVPALDAIADSRHELVGVVTRPDAPSGRGRKLVASPVAQRAEELGVPVLKPEHPRDPDFQAGAAPRCAPTPARSWRTAPCCPQSALDLVPHGWINLHFSVLPSWRGAAPVQHSLWAGDEVTGATTFRIVKALDAGPVFGVMTERIRPTDTAGDLLARLAEGGAGLLVQTLDGIEDGTLEAREQQEEGVSFAPKILVEDARIDWSLPAVAIDRQVRACTPAPGAWSTFEGERIKIGPRAPGRPRAAGARASSRSPRTPSTSAPPPRPSSSARSRPSARSRWVPPTGPAAYAWSRASASATAGCRLVSRPARPEDVDEICGGLPETELGISWGDRPTWKVPRGDKGKGFVLYRAPHKTAVDPETGEMYDDLVVITTPTEVEKHALVADESTPFFTIDHFKGYAAVLVQQSRLGRDRPRRARRDHHRRLGGQGARRSWCGSTSVSDRRRPVDQARRAALDVLTAVRTDDAYANLVLPQVLRKHGLDGRDAALATELVVRGDPDAGAVRRRHRRLPDQAAAPGRRSATCCAWAPHQLLSMRVPDHAAISTSVDLVRASVGRGPAGLVNAVLRTISRRDLAGLGRRGRTRPAGDLVRPPRRRPVPPPLGRRRPWGRRWPRPSAATRSSRRCWRPTTPRRGSRWSPAPGMRDRRGARGRRRHPHRPVAVRRDPGRWRPVGRPGRRRGTRRRPGRGLAARRARARRRARSRAATSGGSTCAPGPAARPRCWRRSPPSAGPCSSPTSGSRTGPRWSRPRCVPRRGRGARARR